MLIESPANEEYCATVRRKFPCPKGYRELLAGEKPDVVFFRTTLKRKTLLGFRDNSIILQYGTLETIENPCWYVVKEQIMSRQQMMLEYCRLVDGKRNHANWCELTTGLWHSCDCHLADRNTRLIVLSSLLGLLK